MRLLSLESDDRAIVALVALDPGGPLLVSDAPGLLEHVLEVFPGIRRHRCTSPESGLLATELPSTEIAHLLEHLVLESLVQQGHPRTVSGRTTWDWARDGEGTYRVRIAAASPPAAEAALRQGVRMLSDFLGARPTD